MENNLALITALYLQTYSLTTTPLRPFLAVSAKCALRHVYNYFYAKVHHLQFSSRHPYLGGTFFPKVHVI